MDWVARLTAALALAAGTGLAQRPLAAAPDEGVETEAQQQLAARSYEIRYIHTVRNKTDKPVPNVKVYIPVPPADEGQAIEGFAVLVDGVEVRAPVAPDASGCPIARVTLRNIQPAQTVEVSTRWRAKMTPMPRIAIDRSKVGKLEDIPKEIRDRFTGDRGGTYDLEHPLVKQAAAEISKGKTNVWDIVVAAHDFVADSGRFRYARGDGWDGAAVVLDRKSGSCSEFAFLFSALCRRNGIPTRLVGATRHGAQMPYTDTVYHRWAEVFVPGYGWVPVDPTLDRGSPCKRDFLGARGPRCLVVSRRDVGSTMGKQYISANTDGGAVSRTRRFVWTPIEQQAPAAPKK